MAFRLWTIFPPHLEDRLPFAEDYVSAAHSMKTRWFFTETGWGWGEGTHTLTGRLPYATCCFPGDADPLHPCAAPCFEFLDRF
jgi:hypothetical protein